MGDTTGISWADSTWNPWFGCQKISTGCDNCYAEALMDTRWHRVQWGPGKARQRTSAANWRQPLLWDRQHAAFFQAHGHNRRVFCASLGDVFDNEVPESWRMDLFDLIKWTPHLSWLLLTKRIGNVLPMLDSMDRVLPDHAWMGITVVNQAEADRDIPKLLAVPARIRFLSMEPLLGPVDLTSFLGDTKNHVIDITHRDLCLRSRQGGTVGDSTGRDNMACTGEHGEKEAWEQPSKSGNGPISMIIIGGESGPHARPMHLDWARSLVRQCRASETACFVKQGGNSNSCPHDRKGGHFECFPPELQVREWPNI